MSRETTRVAKINIFKLWSVTIFCCLLHSAARMLSLVEKLKLVWRCSPGRITWEELPI